MTRKFNLTFMTLLAGAALWLTPAARADQWDKRTILTFSEPVEIPGQVLQPGNYVFKLADTDDRTTVLVYTEDEQNLVAMINAVAAYRVGLTSETVITFEERAAGAPHALHDWFYPGEHDGIEFTYQEAEK